MLGTRIPSPLRRLSPTKRDPLGAAPEGNLSVKAAGTLEVPGQGQGAEAATEADTVTKILAMCSEAANAVAEAAIEAVREAAREEDIEVTREGSKEEDIEEAIEVLPEIA
jgi:hypothetical protein